MSTPAPSQTDVSVGTGRTMPAQAELLPRKKYYHNPYQPTIREILNQTDVGPGHRKVKYAYIFLAIGSCLFLAGITYTGLRIAKQFVVYRLEFLGPLLIALSFVCLGVTIKYCYDARKEGNLWRRQLRFRPDGLGGVTVVDMSLQPAEDPNLKSGTATEKAIKKMPKGGRRKRRGPRSRAGSQATMGSRTTLDSVRTGYSGVSSRTPTKKGPPPPYYQVDLPPEKRPLPRMEETHEMYAQVDHNRARQARERRERENAMRMKEREIKDSAL